MADESKRPVVATPSLSTLPSHSTATLSSSAGIGSGSGSGSGSGGGGSSAPLLSPFAPPIWLPARPFDLPG